MLLHRIVAFLVSLHSSDWSYVVRQRDLHLLHQLGFSDATKSCTALLHASGDFRNAVAALVQHKSTQSGQIASRDPESAPHYDSGPTPAFDGPDISPPSRILTNTDHPIASTKNDKGTETLRETTLGRPTRKSKAGLPPSLRKRPRAATQPHGASSRAHGASSRAQGVCAKSLSLSSHSSDAHGCYYFPLVKTPRKGNAWRV